MTTVAELIQDKRGVVWTVEPDDTVFHALEIMAEKDIGALPVVGPSGLVGILSERDYARRGILLGRASKTTQVKDIMTTSLYSVQPDHSLDRCMSLMTNKHVRHLPVVDAQGALVGFISIGDVLKAIIREQQEHINRLALRETGHVVLD
jgi:CBS domain-containing protein